MITDSQEVIYARTYRNTGFCNRLRRCYFRHYNVVRGFVQPRAGNRRWWHCVEPAPQGSKAVVIPAAGRGGFRASALIGGPDGA